MIETLPIEEEAVEIHDTPKLLVEWTSRRREFFTSIGPALGRSERRLAGESPFGLVPLRIMIPSYCLEALLIFAAILVYTKIEELRPYVVPKLASHEVIYYSGDELPRTEDLGGAQAGTTGRAGGEEAHHRTQTIKIARGGSLVPRIVDAPNLKLPSSSDAVANLLAVRPNPGPPPSEGMRSVRTVPNLSASVVAPAPNATRDYTRNGITLNGVIAPAPSVSRDRPLVAPTFSANVVPPAPDVSREHTLVAPRLAPAVIPPAPSVSRDRALVAPSLTASVVAPAPSVTRDASRSNPSMAANVIPPAPTAVNREASTAPVQMANVTVVPPPVSSPERNTSRNSKLSMPAPAVIAPPSNDVSHDARRVAAGSAPDPSKAVVPPPASSTGFVSSLIGKIFGPTEVVAPPPAVNSGANARTNSLSANVVAPPPTVSPTSASGNPQGSRKGAGATLNSNVIAPPTTAGVSGGTGTRSLADSTANKIGMPSVVPPPPSLTGEGGGSGNTGGGAGTARGTLTANNVVPPPPSLGGGSATTGSGLSRKGAGLGAPLDVGAAVNPANGGGGGNNAGAVISTQPGPKIGVPPTTTTGSLAMSPGGGEKPGLGGSGGGTSIGHSAGPGSSVRNEGPGAGKTGAGRGSDADSHGGISPQPGPGGAGDAPSGNPPVPGVSVSGGSTVVNLPSFGSDPAASDPKTPARSAAKGDRPGLRVSIQGTSSSGGAFNFYGVLKGVNRSIYIDSTPQAVMQYVDPSATAHVSARLTDPEAFRMDLPANLPHVQLIVMCVLEASGNIKNVTVYQGGTPEMNPKVLAALHNWKFHPAMIGDQPVEVTAAIGFNIDTNDHY